jgi:hypothetical protein
MNFKEQDRPPIRYFEESADGGAQVLALCARHRVAGTLRPLWLIRFMGLETAFNFMWTMWTMTNLPIDITPEIVVHRTFKFYIFTMCTTDEV